MQPSEGAFMFSVPTWRKHWAPLPSTWERSASHLLIISSHLPQPRIISVVLCWAVSCTGVQTETLFPHATSQVPTKDLMASLGLLTVLPWAQSGLHSGSWEVPLWFVLHLLSSRTPGFSAHTCVASHASVGLLHRVALFPTGTPLLAVYCDHCKLKHHWADATQWVQENWAASCFFLFFAS